MYKNSSDKEESQKKLRSQFRSTKEIWMCISRLSIVARFFDWQSNVDASKITIIILIRTERLGKQCAILLFELSNVES